MKKFRASELSGQGTLEYILLTALVVGIVMTAFNGPLRRFLATYQSRQTEYTNVMTQRNMGIPMGWFGGNYANPGGGPGATGGATAGADPGADPADTPPPTGAGEVTPPAVAGTNGQAGDGANPPEGPTGYAGPGGAGAGPNNSLLSPSDTRTAANTRGGRGGRTTAGEGDEEGTQEGGSTARTGGLPANRAGSGSIEDEDEQAPPNETEEEKQARVRRAEEGETLKQAEGLYGPTTRRVREGSCGDLDLKVILQIAFVIGLFFLLASMLFQKRGRGD